jgi:hypothetical protein
MSSVRRLTAILAADVAGYSCLMGADEEGTHARLKAHLRELIEPKIAEHRGRIVKNTGDGFLAEFPSVVDAMRGAVEVQRGMAECNAAIPADERIEFRIGINLGDIAAGDKIENEIPLAAASIKTALGSMLSGTRDRYENLANENTALGWVGWRGSREQEIQELVLFAHEISTTAANADLALARLQLKATALNKVAPTCETATIENGDGFAPLMTPMKLRELTKMRGMNDGTRSLFEAIMISEIIVALRDWGKSSSAGVLIGWLASSFYCKPPLDQEIDFLLLGPAVIPETVRKIDRQPCR